MKFDDYRISPEIRQNLQELGFRKPTDIQFKALPPILKGEDVLAIAQTGTGKTAAFAIPVLHLLQQRKQQHSVKGIQCLVLVPTHELALQISKVFVQLAKDTGIQITSIHGGVEQDPQVKKLEEGVDVLVATPGRLFDLIHQEHLYLETVQVLILDEADHMLDLGFLKDIRDLIRFMPHKRQTLFFSATINEKIKKLAYSLVRNPIRIQISPKDPVAKNIHHSVAFIAMDDKRFFLERLIHENPEAKILVFVRTKVRAERVCKALERVEVPSLTIHGDKEQESRFEVMDQFRNGIVKVLVATDVSARGIDIPGVDFVVNYDLPEQDENYVHRVGRTGRGTHKGQAVAFCSPEEEHLLRAIEEYLGKEIDVLSIDGNLYSETLEIKKEKENDWKSLMEDAEKAEQERNRKKRRR
jgi:ATP-dependent RNA helicase RhlE